MKPKYMLDTNICIYLMKNQPAEVAERFARCFVGDVVISSITLAELEYGVVCSGDAELSNRAALASFLEDVPVVPFEPTLPEPMARPDLPPASASAMPWTS